MKSKNESKWIMKADAWELFQSKLKQIQKELIKICCSVCEKEIAKVFSKHLNSPHTSSAGDRRVSPDLDSAVVSQGSSADTSNLVCNCWEGYICEYCQNKKGDER